MAKVYHDTIKNNLKMLYYVDILMIPKIIHYFTFGGHDTSPIVKRCVSSWESNCPEFHIKKWDEKTFDINSHPFALRMYQEKKYAFVADYARLFILEKEGGVYLDTDMELVRDISTLLDKELVLGEEEPGIISAGMIAATPHHPYIQKCLAKYDTIDSLPRTIPRLMTDAFTEMKDSLTSVRVCPPITFYPYSAKNIHKYKKELLTEDSYGVHLWNYSWGHPLNRAFKKLRIHSLGTKIVTALGLKPLLKRIFGFI